jgi:hypothetical protein
MDQAEDADIEEETDGRVSERRVEMMEGPLRTGDMVSYYMAFWGMEMPSAVRHMFNGSISNSTVSSAQREIVQSLRRERKMTI